MSRRIFKGDGSYAMRYGHLLTGLNISGVACHITTERLDECILHADACLEPLDRLLKGSSRATERTQPWLTLAILGQPGQKCYVQLGRDSSLLWKTEVGNLVCRLMMPRPPQRVLLVSSTVCICNRTPADIEIRFLVQEVNATANADGSQFTWRPVIPGRVPIDVDEKCINSDALVTNEGPANGKGCGGSSVAAAEPTTASPSRVPAPPGHSSHAACGPDGTLRLGSAGGPPGFPPSALAFLTL